MRFIFRTIFFCCAMFVAMIPSPGLLADTEGQSDILPYLYQAKMFYQGVEDYSCVFLKEERLDGKMQKPETILFKFQKPFRVYMKWIKDPNKGRELLFVPGKYDNKLKVHIGGLLNFILPSITISPDSPMVLEHSRHSITGAGLGNLINSLIDQFELAKQQGDLRVIVHGAEKVQGTDCLRVERVLPKDKGYYCHRLMLYLNKENHVPVKVMVYDWNDVLIEAYTFSQVQWNLGLSDEDFDSHNREYAFGIF